MGKQEVEKLKTRMKAVEEALGLGSNAAKNINLLLDSIRVQGEQAANLNMQNQQLQGMLDMQMRFMKADKEVGKKYEAFMQAEKAKAIAEQAAKQEAMKHPIPLEFKTPPRPEQMPQKLPKPKNTPPPLPPDPIDGTKEIPKAIDSAPDPAAKPKDKDGKIQRKKLPKNPPLESVDKEGRR